jgi:hypothetical protein
VAFGGQPPGPIEPELGHVRALAQALVSPLLLAELLARTGHVEDVIDDLEQHAKLGCERPEQRDPLVVAGRVEQQHALDRGADQAPGLQLVQPPQAVGAIGRGARDVDVLAPDHALHPGRRGQPRGGRDEVGGIGRLARQQ